MEDATQLVDGLEVEFHAPITPGNSTFSISEIEEEEPNDQVPQARYGVVRKQHVEGVGEEDVYVAVGKSSSSMDALTWTLKHGATPSTFVYLVHVFPEVHHIPTPSSRLAIGYLMRAFLSFEDENLLLPVLLTEFEFKKEKGEG
ncbi:hypothetical protein ACLOJK_031009 [Asimina triloba]